MDLSVVTYNMHKGKSFWFRDYRIQQMRDGIEQLSPDIIFLQEIPGIHPQKFDQLLDPLAYFAEPCSSHYCYGKNAVYRKGHHGNAIISRFALGQHKNLNISQTRLAVRGLLHAETLLPLQHKSRLHLLNVHLDLFEAARQKQAAIIMDYIKSEIPRDDAIILAGDFNDWRKRLDGIFEPYLERAKGKKERSFTSPSLFPIYDLDRIYLRNIALTQLHVERSAQWARLSDHLPLRGVLRLLARPNN